MNTGGTELGTLLGGTELGTVCWASLEMVRAPERWAAKRWGLGREALDWSDIDTHA